MALSIGSGNNDALQAALARQQAAQEAKAAGEENKATATTNKQNAETVLNGRNGTVNTINTKLINANTELASITSNYNQVQLSVNSLQTAYQNACNQYIIAQKSGDNNAITVAQNAINNAKAQLDAENENLNNIGTQKEAKEAEIAEIEQELAEAKTEQAEAKTALEQADENLAKAEATLREAENKLAEADKEVEDIQAAIAEEEAAAAAAAKGDDEIDGIEKTHLSEEDAIAQGYTIIRTVDDLKAIGNNLSGKYIIMGDIDLDGFDWAPIGDSENPFTGELNGNGYAIKNLKIDATGQDDVTNVGFFGVTENATVTNVDFIDAEVITEDGFLNGSTAVGIVAGLARGTEFTNITVSGTAKGYDSVGGLVGQINDNSYKNSDGEVVPVGNSYISNVSTDVDITSKYSAGGLVGSIIGTNTGEGVATRDLKITNCETAGNITCTEEAAGGLIGQAGKTIITVNQCASNVNLTWDNTENDGDLSFLMETGRIGGFIGCVDGSYIAICNSEFNGEINAEGDFQGNYYGWYMNDAQVTLYELPEGLPVDDILNIDGVDGLTPVTDANGVNHYQVTVSTLTGLDKMVTMIQANPDLADIITFNVNFDFEAMDGMYDQSVYSQYGIVQHLYEDEDGNVHNDVYIDNEIDLETTFHQSATYATWTTCEVTESESLTPTMVSGLYKNKQGAYVVNTDDGYKEVSMNFNSSNQVTNVTKRLQSDEVRYREYITEMVLYYQEKMHAALKALFGLTEDADLPIINKAQYKKLLAMQEAGQTLTSEQKLAIATFEVDYAVMNKVADTTHNNGCGMGGNASFLDETTAVQMYDDTGRPLFTTLNGDALRQRMNEDGTLAVDEDGEPIYEYEDGSDYEGIAEVFAQRGYPVTDEDGNFMYKDADGNDVTKTQDEDGNDIYTYADGSKYEGEADKLTQQLEKYDNKSEYNNLENEMKGILSDVESGKYPLQDDNTQESKSKADVETESEVPTGNSTTEDVVENTHADDVVGEDADDKKKDIEE